MQLIACQQGGSVQRPERREYGRIGLEITESHALFKGVPEKITCWMSHGDSVVELPEGFTVMAQTENTPIAAISSDQKHLYGVQFHPEVMHTECGKLILDNFLFDICHCRGDWTMGAFIETQIEQIKKQVGDKKVLCALSGGIDSAVSATLVHRAVGDQLTCVFVNHGLLRKGEPESVVETFDKSFHMNLVYVDAVDRFLGRLAGVSDPEEKRKIIGSEFIRVFEEEAGKLGEIEFLVQGTIYPDVIESGTATAATIKSHHNVGGLPEDLEFSLVEPLRELFKDEVRLVAKELGLPEDIVRRQPFPGPGLGIRIIGDITPEKLAILREADAIMVDEIRKAGMYDEIWQVFAVLPTIQSVGVMGDERTYAYPIILRAVTSVDGMTADWVRFPYEVLERISSRVINEVKGINRLLYDITSKPPGTIEWE
jgi:GMP synthase (glutamine-hydrolysing)